MSPSSTADDTGGYGGCGVEGLAFPYYGTGATASHPNEGLSQCHGCATEDVVTPHASFLALDVAPQQAYANIRRCGRVPRHVRPGQLLRCRQRPARRPPRPRLDQSMIMAALDNALNNRAIQRDFARDPISWAARTYLSTQERAPPPGLRVRADRWPVRVVLVPAAIEPPGPLPRA